MNTAMIDKVNRSEFRERPFTKKNDFREINRTTQTILFSAIVFLDLKHSRVPQNK